ncbi:MAG: EAL domain-containing protein [Thermodesulfobacteriota bacterium]|jgi:diguanylate cyclase (GGDEF)-like protein/PAS domain S-box-containing protein|nr:EAL domain-containing protein [Thermodesulfobacteriota bacterium]
MSENSCVRHDIEPREEVILLVEDAQGFARIVTRILEKAGFTLAVVGSGSDALAWLRKHDPSLMLLDYTLPDMSGRAVIETLQTDGRFVPFVIITGNGDERVAVDMMKLGAFDYLVKDEAFLTLLPSVVRQTLDRISVSRRLQETEEMLEERQEHLRAFAAALPDMVFVLDEEGRFVETLSGENGSDAPWSGSLTGRYVRDVFGPRNALLFQGAIQETLASGTTQVVEYSLFDNKTDRWFEGRTAPVNFRDRPPLVAWVARDITERKKSEEELRKLLRAIEQSPSIVMITDADGVIEYVNPTFCQVTGYRPEEVQGQSPNLLKSDVHPEEFHRRMWNDISSGQDWRGEFANCRKSGDVYWEHAMISPVRNERGHVTHYLKVAEDITARKNADEKIHTLTYFDVLTGLPNQALFYDRVRQGIATAHRTGEKLGVAVVDIDHFQRINNAFAHEFGDQALRMVADRLCRILREEDTIARFWGDSFLLALPRLRSEADLLSVTYKISNALIAPFRIEQREIFLTVSMGLALFPSDGTTVDVLLKNAEAALARSKEQGPGGYAVYAPSMNRQASESLMLQGDLRKAIDSGQFELFYQPQLDVATRRVVGAEALVRWRHPTLGLLFPDKFIQMAEETNLICPLGEWIILDACRQLAQWNKAGSRNFRMSINLSPRQFHSSDCVAVIEQGVRKYGIDPTQLTFEITETLILWNTEKAINALNRLKEMGCHVAIDDFGTGYSSLGYLQKFPLNTIKIDKSFVMQCDLNPQDASICRTIIAMAHSLGLRVLAEGVEKEEHYSFLRDNGCHEMQGYLFSKPVAVDEFSSRWLNKG